MRETDSQHGNINQPPTTSWNRNQASNMPFLAKYEPSKGNRHKPTTNLLRTTTTNISIVLYEQQRLHQRRELTQKQTLIGWKFPTNHQEEVTGNINRGGASNWVEDDDAKEAEPPPASSRLNHHKPPASRWVSGGTGWTKPLRHEKLMKNRKQLPPPKPDGDLDDGGAEGKRR
jgi:hypothetical protein